jgi:RNA polymerase sigma-70 factor (ECF subfamily)
MTDEELIRKIAKGEAKAFEMLFEKYKGSVYGLGLRLLASSSLAEDNSQEAWIKIVQAAPQYKDQGNAKAWILRITKNTALNTLRKRGWEQELSLEDSEQIEDSGKDLLSVMAGIEDTNRLKKAIDQLPQRQRVILVLWMSEEKSYEDLAKEMYISLNAAKVLLFRAKENLQKMLISSSREGS